MFQRAKVEMPKEIWVDISEGLAFAEPLTKVNGKLPKYIRADTIQSIPVTDKMRIAGNAVAKGYDVEDIFKAMIGAVE